MADEDARLAGATCDLERLVRTHLFVIGPNNSGTTFLSAVLAKSRHTWNLRREGQHTFGFVGPATRGTEVPLVWASEPAWIAHFADPAAYDWAATRRAWYFQAFARSPEASVFVTKAPPFLLVVDQLAEAFREARFLFLVRDPYATAEGIVRRRERQSDASRADVLRRAARHLVACFERQRANVAAFADRGVFFTYEAMCADPAGVGAQIRRLVPALGDLDLDQRVAVKGIYDERLRDMNADQIARLSADDLRALNEVFRPKQDVLAAFGYALREP